MRTAIFTVCFLSTSLATAFVHKVQLEKELPKPPAVDLYRVGAPPTKGPLPPLSQLKDYEIHLKWTECVKLAPQVFAKAKDVQGWVGVTWLQCLSESQKKVKNRAMVARALAAIESHPALMAEGPWATKLEKSYLEMKIDFLEEQVQRKEGKAADGFDALLSGRYALSRGQKSRAYQLLADLALQRNDYAEAQFYYQAAQDQADSKYLQERLEFIARTQGIGRTTTPSPSAQAPEVGGEELKLEERMKSSLVQNDAVSAIKDNIKILNEYPGSRVARRLKEKPLEIYNTLSEKMIKMKALSEMGEADGSLLLEWAQNLHRRADYAGAQALSMKAVEKLSKAPSSTSALWIAGRSAHFLGQYEQALEIYRKLISFHGGSDEAAEALMRSALIYFRKQEYTSASALLERLVQQGRDRYDLIAQYWLVRSFQESKSERAALAAAALMEKYPFSYYGLRLRAEAQNGKLTWPEPKEAAPALAGTFYVVGEQKSSWLRFKILSEAGWVGEAQEELSLMPFLKDPTLKVHLAQKMMERHQYVTAIRWINEAVEADPRLRQAQFVKVGYPEAFTSLYQVEADRYGIDAVLFKSLTRQESAFNLTAISTSNALGLMQMIPPTAQEVARKLGLKIEIPGDMFRPEVNIPMGSYYISQMLDQFQGNVPFALAAYNAGPYRMKLWIEGRTEVGELLSRPSSAPVDELWFDELPWTETSFYVKAILRNVLLYRLSAQGSYQLNPVLWQDLLIKKAK